MGVPFSVNAYVNKIDQQYTIHLQENDERDYPLITMGKDSYIVSSMIETNISPTTICNIQLGRYNSVAKNTIFLVDMNHDYRKVCQGRISELPYSRMMFPNEFVKRKGSLIILNDCWIGENATIMGGVIIGNGAIVAANTVVTQNVPAYAIVAGNPAQIIGYRFTKEQIEKLNIIKWWNWDSALIKENATDLYGDIDNFIEKYYKKAAEEIQDEACEDSIPKIEGKDYSKRNRILYFPDFEQDYPTYPHVIDSFAKTYHDTDYELLLYVEEDEWIEEKLRRLDSVFEKYEDVTCYINLFVGKMKAKRILFANSDIYVMNRSIDNVKYVEMALDYGIRIVSGVDVPIFDGEINLQGMIRE